MKDCKTCVWFGKEKTGQCGNYLSRNQSEYDPRFGIEEGAEKSGVLIRGMEMPTSCAYCRFEGGGYCFAKGEKILHVGRRDDVHPDCPLAPAADVRPVVRGKWRPHKTKTWKNWWKCSACDYVSEHKAHHNYCPNCGARMEES